MMGNFYRYLKQALLLSMLSVTGISYAQEPKAIWLDELGASPCYIQDWGKPEVNRSVLGTPLTVGGKVYERGIGAHSICRMFFDLGADAVSVSGSVGGDDNNPFRTAFQFKIVGDRKELWRSGVLRKGDAVKEFDVDLSGIDKVLLLVEECGDGIMYDHADWLNVKFLTRGAVTPIPVWAKPIPKGKYVLTPPAPDTPRINNPLVYGARPGNPFLMAVTASGKRPMTFEAAGLPDELTLDPQTGVITGKTTAKGDFKVLLRARNDMGTAEQEILLRMGDKIMLTPPMGWCSWNCWRFSTDDRKVRDAARTMHRRLQAYGWTYVNIDDGWEAEARNYDGVLLPDKKFPDIRSLTDTIHSLGLKFGLYSSPGRVTCGERIGSYGHELTDAVTWGMWGVDYLKYDYCGYAQIQRNSEEKTIQEPYLVMRDALDKVTRDIVYCVGYGAPNVWKWGAEAGGNLWRTTRDITDEWNVVMAIGCFQDVCAAATAPGRYNDPDMLVVGRLGQGWGAPAHDSDLTPDEQYAHISLWSILSAPLLIGCDMTVMDDFTLGLLTNREVLAVNQDPLAAPAVKKIVPNGQIWYKKLCDGSYALGFFQMDPYFVLWDQDTAESIQEQTYEFELDLKELGLGPKVAIRDLWRQKNLGEFRGSYEGRVPYHGVSLLKITPVK